MFTGLVEEVGVVSAVNKTATGMELGITCESVADGLKVGDSVAVDGVCLTVVEVAPKAFAVQAVAETLRRTTLGNYRRGWRVNLERALRSGDRLGGHLVQGHVDDVGEVKKVTPGGEGKVMEVTLPRNLRPFVVPKGSIAVDGVSLTVARLEGASLEIWLVPHTLKRTTLGEKRPGDLVNLEVDILGKYVAHMLQRAEFQPLSMERLHEWGY
ncbi:MAG: riboflavin synthase [candidate division KSB1 bacterium]|nr:riboflavin synthase [candidate division KSB1 bacterium]MDZ7294348.1 riboflavin synthase [candidate division KSB1 bacterium]MDZ7378253.1 riboflavin synthase [candidate division KSB1 bacterium]MDZ7385970.1 riboflavin synthase [candidate division KSB1 bacterium]MDZ7393320.1 riboflavin synthase [candidate division KSB1 bacterium]